MTTQQTIPIFTRFADNRVQQVGGGLSKACKLADAIRKPDIFDMGVEFKLFARLLIAEGGVMTGTYEQLGGKFGQSPRNVHNWADALKKSGMVEVEEGRHKQIKIRLCEPYFSIAAAEDKIAPPPADAMKEDPELVELIQIYRTAKATRANIRVNVERVFENGKTA